MISGHNVIQTKDGKLFKITDEMDINRHIKYDILLDFLESEENSKKDVTVVKTYNITEEYDPQKLSILVKHYEMSDGTWEAINRSYKYRLEITGRMPNAVKDSTFVFLSNIEDIPFQKAMMASGLSSNLEDYFDLDEAIFVALK